MAFSFRKINQRALIMVQFGTFVNVRFLVAGIVSMFLAYVLKYYTINKYLNYYLNIENKR